MAPDCIILTAFFTDVANNVATVTASSVDSVNSRSAWTRSAWTGGGAFEADDDAPEVGVEEFGSCGACRISGGIVASSEYVS